MDGGPALRWWLFLALAATIQRQWACRLVVVLSCGGDPRLVAAAQSCGLDCRKAYNVGFCGCGQILADGSPIAPANAPAFLRIDAIGSELIYNGVATYTCNTTRNTTRKPAPTDTHPRIPTDHPRTCTLP